MKDMTLLYLTPWGVSCLLIAVDERIDSLKDDEDEYHASPHVDELDTLNDIKRILEGKE